jgi:hypothetical protein
MGNPPHKFSPYGRGVAMTTKRDKPIRRWHVGLVADLLAGKNVGIEAAAAIENLEDQLFRAETELWERQ